jgi:hypothetical protein
MKNRQSARSKNPGATPAGPALIRTKPETRVIFEEMLPGVKLQYGGQIYARSEQLKLAVDRMRDCPADWLSVMLIELATECLSNSMELIRGIEEMSVSRCAWAARNLLELSYFIRYVAQSPENARRFHEDAMCDLKDVLKKLETLNPLAEAVAQNKAQLDQYMKIMEQVKDEDSYLKVAKLADSLGEKIIYDTANKYLSKFVHPTSVSIQAKKDLNLMNLAVEQVIKMALFFMQSAFPALVKCLDDLAPKPAA